MTPVNLRAGKRLLLALPRVLGRYLETRKSLRGSISRQSRQGLDWMNFFLADVQTAFGAFVAFYLAGLGWPKDQVGLALTVGTLAGVISQIPGGALVDALRWKRGLAAIGIGMLCASALILALVPNFALVFLAEILHGLTAGIVTPAIAAISLGLVGRRAMSVRTGRNYQFNAAGNAITAGLMGLAGQYFATSAIFFGAAALCIPALIALSRIRPEEIDYARARNAGKGKQAKSYHRIFDLGKNRNLYIFAACVFLFQFADNFAAAGCWPEPSAKPDRIRIVIHSWLDRHAANRGCDFVAMGGLPFRKVGTQAAAASGLWAGHYSLAVVCVLCERLGPFYRPITRRHQRCGRHRTHNPGGHRSDHRYRPIQLGTRVHRHPDLHRRFDQHYGNRLSFRGAGPLGRFSDPGSGFRCSDGVAVGGNARDNAG